jgi:hypothetical protein
MKVGLPDDLGPQMTDSFAKAKSTHRDSGLALARPVQSRGLAQRDSVIVVINMSSVTIPSMPDAIRRIADSSERQLAWEFFVFVEV